MMVMEERFGGIDPNWDRTGRKWERKSFISVIVLKILGHFWPAQIQAITATSPAVDELAPVKERLLGMWAIA
jgi:hypothetical protein